MRVHTTLRNLSKRQARASLQVDVLAVYECAQCIQWFAREEVGFSSLYSNTHQQQYVFHLSLVDPSERLSMLRGVGMPYVFQVVEEISYSFAF